MRNWFLWGPLFDGEPAAGGGSGAGAPAEAALDPGAPFEHSAAGAEPRPPAAAKPAEKSDVEKRLDAVERDNRAKDQRIEELSQSERYWAGKARGTATPEVPAEDLDDEPAPVESPFEGEKPEQLLDDLSVNGLKALHKRGLITTDQLVKQVSQLEKRIYAEVDAKLAQQREWSQLEAKFSEFPELLADSELVSAGQQPKTEIYKRTQVHFRQMVQDDPKLKNSTGAMLAAARLAKKELELEGKAAGTEGGNRQQSRRERIAAQAPDRDGGSGEGGEPGDDQLSPTARNVVNNLSRFGITDEDFRKYAKEPVNGRVRH
jgi:hypothetical protein